MFKCLLGCYFVSCSINIVAANIEAALSSVYQCCKRGTLFYQNLSTNYSSFYCAISHLHFALQNYEINRRESIKMYEFKMTISLQPIFIHAKTQRTIINAQST